MPNIADTLLEHQGPPVKIEGIIRALGLELDTKAELNEEIAGQLERIHGGRYKISVNKNDHYYRRRFTMAHELGHYLFHVHLISEGVDDTRAYRSEPEGKFYNTKITKSEETEANQFAASILMPAKLVTDLYMKDDNLDELAKKFQVSKTSMKIRLRGLRLLDQPGDAPAPDDPI